MTFTFHQIFLNLFALPVLKVLNPIAFIVTLAALAIAGFQRVQERLDQLSGVA